MPDLNTNLEVARLAAQIVSAHVGHNNTAPEAIPIIIQTVFTALLGVVKEEGVPTAAPAATMAPTPAVPVKKSVFPDYLICLEDGKKLKMLKRHLAASYKMSPEQYREKWGLPDDYPMVAPNYARHRSDLAKSIGLGRGGVAAPATGESVPDIVQNEAPARTAAPRQPLRVPGVNKSGKKASKIRRSA